MKTNDIIIIYVAYTGTSGGKRRPVLVVKDLSGIVYLYRITSKYVNKSEKIKSSYYPIEKWKDSGLKKKSYIDTGSLIEVEEHYLYNTKSIGRLSILDQIGLAEFLKNN